MSIHKNKNGSVTIRWRIHMAGKQTFKYETIPAGTPKIMSVAKEREIELKSQRHNYVYTERKDYTIQELAQFFLDKTKIKKGHWKNCEAVLRIHILPMLGHIPISKLRISNVEEMVERSLNERFDGKQGKPKTRNAEGACIILQMVLNFSVEKDYITFNPIKGKTASLLPKSDKKKRLFASDEEVNAILTEAKNAVYTHKVTVGIKGTKGLKRGENIISLTRSGVYHIPFYFSATTGIRRAELCALTWRDVDMESSEPTMSIDRAISDDEDNDDVKTEYSRRTISITQTHVQLLKERKEDQFSEFIRKGRVVDADDYIFTNPNTLDHYHPDTLSSEFKKMVKKAFYFVSEQKVNVRNVTLHDMRHYHASTLLRNNNVNIKVISERLGHSSVAFTLDEYGHLMKGADLEAAHEAVGFLNDPLK